MKNTRVVSGGRRGGSVLAGERKDSGSHSREWRGEVAACSLARERRRRQSLAACTWPLRDREKTLEPLLSKSSCFQPA